MRLIDTDGARRRIVAFATGLHSEVMPVETVLMLLTQMQTIDAVPVVRCRDCKHYEIHKPKVLENCERNGYIIPMKPDDFCSYGERKGGAD